MLQRENSNLLISRAKPVRKWEYLLNKKISIQMLILSSKILRLWPRQESNLDLELRKLLYYPLYYEALAGQQMCDKMAKEPTPPHH